MGFGKSGWPCFFLKSMTMQIEFVIKIELNVTVSLRSAACIIFSTGSTGRPKGTLSDHTAYFFKEFAIWWYYRWHNGAWWDFLALLFSRHLTAKYFDGIALGGIIRDIMGLSKTYLALLCHSYTSVRCYWGEVYNLIVAFNFRVCSPSATITDSDWFSSILFLWLN